MFFNRSLSVARDDISFFILDEMSFFEVSLMEVQGNFFLRRFEGGG